MRRKRAKPAGNSRDNILREAANLFRHEGYHAVALSDIAEAVGMRKAGLYHYFPAKEAILCEILMRGIDAIATSVQEVAESALGPSEKLRRAIYSEVNAVTKGIDAAAAIVVIREPKTLSPRVRQRFVAGRDRIEGYFRSIVEDGVKQGIFRRVNVKLFVFGLLGMCNWVVQWYSPGGQLTVGEIGDAFADYVLTGLLTGAGLIANQQKVASVGEK